MKKNLLLNQGDDIRLKQKKFGKGLKGTLSFLSVIIYLLVSASSFAQTKQTVTGTITDDKGQLLVGVGVRIKNTTIGTSTDVTGTYKITVTDANTVLVFSYLGFSGREIPVNGKSTINVRLEPTNSTLQEVVVTGYGTQKRESITGAISSVTSKDIDRVHGGSTVSTGLAGKLPGVTFRQAEGRPGASASIQIRNMGTPLYVIDGIQQDEGQFNNLAPNDVESITVLKDASAAIYGVRAGNGVVVVTTKRGSGESRINVDSYLGFQYWDRFPNVLTNSYDYMRYLAAAQVVTNGSTAITPAELDKYKQGTQVGYQSFNWKPFVLANKGAPLNSVHGDITGGTDRVNYYVAGTTLYQNDEAGAEYNYRRTNIQSNVRAKVASGLTVNMNINGRVETRENPGVPGADDYFLARLGILENTPLDRPYANDNPAYLRDNGPHTEANYAFLNKTIAGVYHQDWRVLQANFGAEYEIPGVKGLVARYNYSYYIADELLNNHEYTYNAYTYNQTTKNYDITHSVTNPCLPGINENSDSQRGGEISLAYNNKIGGFTYNVGGNFSYSRHYNNINITAPFGNSLDQYRNSIANRLSNINWGYEVIGQFTSVAQINAYKVNEDSKGNSTVLPGDLIYKDQNGDGKIDAYDQRPIGYGTNAQPNLNLGFTFGAAYKGFDFHADFSGGSGYSWEQNYESRWAFQNNGNLNTIFEDSWHLSDPYNLNSTWIPGKYPVNRNNVGGNHYDYGYNSSFWVHNVRYIKARTIELGYSIPPALLSKVRVKRARFYANVYNLFSLDNLRQYGIDPEVSDNNGLQTPQNRVFNFGFNLTF